MKPWKLDGARMGYPGDPWRKVRVFEPRWWQLGRWLLILRYRFGRTVAVGSVTIHTDKGSFRVRVVEAERIR